MGYAFGKSSILRAKDVNPILVTTANMALAYSSVDMTIPWMGGKRSATEQKKLFDGGNSRCDGALKKSFHQSGEALDIVPYTRGKINYKGIKEFQQFAKVMFSTFNFLQEVNSVPKNLYLHWGGFWSATDKNKDGYLSYSDDKFGWDQPHWELRSKAQKNVLMIK